MSKLVSRHIFNLVTLAIVFLALTSPFGSSLAQPLAPPNSITPDEAHSIAIRLATELKTAESLPYFESVVARRPYTAPFRNNLGVTLMRLQRYGDAIAAFEAALDLDPKLQDAIDNIKDLYAFWPEMPIGAHSSRILNVPSTVLTSSNSSADDFEDDGLDEDIVENENDDENEDEDEEDDGLGNLSSGHKNYRKRYQFQFHPKNKNPRQRLPRFTPNELLKPVNKLYLRGYLPFVLTPDSNTHDMSFLGSFHLPTSTTENTTALLSMLNLLSDQFGEAVVDFYPTNLMMTKDRPYMTPLSTALMEMKQTLPSLKASESDSMKERSAYNTSLGAYLQWNMSPDSWKNIMSRVNFASLEKIPLFHSDKWFKQCLESEGSPLEIEFTRRTHWRMMLVGSKGAGMFNHADALRTSSYQLQVFGAKRWHLCAPTQRAFLYGAGQVDAFSPDYSKYPLFSKARCWEDVVSAGEIIYYPHDYWHQTLNEGELNVAVSNSVIDSLSYLKIRDTLQVDVCKLDKYRWFFSEELCSTLHSKCLNGWDKLYSGN